jgi:hypothetical protein
MEFVRELSPENQTENRELFRITVGTQFALAVIYGLEVIWMIYAMRWGFFRDSRIIFILEIPF